MVATSGLASVGAAIQATTITMNATNAATVVMSTSLPPLSIRLRIPGDAGVAPTDRLPTPDSKLICHFAVGRRIQAEDFLLLRDAQANGDVHNFEDDPGHGGRERSDGHHGHRLLQQLLRVAVEEAIGASRVDRGCREEAGRQGSP